MITTLLFLTALPLAMSHYETLENRGQASVWPFPQKHEKPTPNYYMVLNPHDFKFKVVSLIHDTFSEYLNNLHILY